MVTFGDMSWHNMISSNQSAEVLVQGFVSKSVIGVVYDLKTQKFKFVAPIPNWDHNSAFLGGVRRHILNISFN